MDDSSASPTTGSSPQQAGCNAVTVALLISLVIGGYWGYCAELFPDRWGQVLGIVFGLIVAILATLLVFFLLMVFTHCAIKLEDFFQAEDIQSPQQPHDK
ncbi:MAG: hypothetical protein HUJ26_12340 [Planctomycetaceae bacterium]|nr:hypothetical protein [Planctomycetaceae bacterium]